MKGGGGGEMVTVTPLKFVKVPGNSPLSEVTPFAEEGTCNSYGAIATSSWGPGDAVNPPAGPGRESPGSSLHLAVFWYQK